MLACALLFSLNLVGSERTTLNCKQDMCVTLATWSWSTVLRNCLVGPVYSTYLDVIFDRPDTLLHKPNGTA